MNISLILNIALNLIRARMKQSAIAAIGVTFGIAMFIALVSFMNGLNNLLDGLMLNRTPHVRMYNEIKPSAQQPITLSESYKNSTNFITSIKPKDRGKEIYNSKSIIAALKKDPRIVDVAPKVTAPVFFNSGTIEITGVVNGIDVPAEEHLFSVSNYIIDGNVFDLASVPNTIIIGKGLSEKMLVKIIERAREIKAGSASGFLDIFLHHNRSQEEMTGLLPEFCRLDDYDIMASVKKWAFHQDTVLSTLCGALLDRKLYKCRLQPEPFDEKMLADISSQLQKKYSVSSHEAAYFVFTGEAVNTTYKLGDEHINILLKDGDCKDISRVDNPLIHQTLSMPVKKFYICHLV